MLLDQIEQALSKAVTECNAELIHALSKAYQRIYCMLN